MKIVDSKQIILNTNSTLLMDYSTKNQATFIVNFRKREKEIDWNRGGVDKMSSVTLATACTDVFSAYYWHAGS